LGKLRGGRGALCGAVLLFVFLATVGVSVRAQDQPSSQPAQQPAAPPTQTPPDQSSPGQSSPGQSSPRPPKDEKKESSNPAEVAAQKTKDVTIQAAEATKKLGEATFAKVRDGKMGG